MPMEYISPTGSGDKSGSSWANAAPITAIDAMIKKAGAGGAVLLAADKGNYTTTSTISITGAGTDGHVVTIKGVDSRTGLDADAHFVGSRASKWVEGAAAGNELFRLQKGADNLDFEHFQVDNTGTVFRIGGDLKNLTLGHMDVSNVQRFVEDYVTGSNATATVTGLTVKNVAVDGYSKDVVRLQYDSSKILIQDVVGDSGGQIGDNFAMGVHLEGTVHNVTFNRVTMENNATVGASGDYWNGDGFATERGTYDIHFVNTVARGNTDGGYDIKSDHVTFDGAVAADNGRNFRIWGNDVTISNSAGLDPHKRGGITTQSQLWLDDGATNVKVVNSSFTDAGSGTKAIISKGNLTFVNSTLTVAATAVAYAGTKPDGLAASAITKVTATGVVSANSVAPATATAQESPAPTIISPGPTAPQGGSTVQGEAVAKVEVAGDWLKIKLTSASETVAATVKAEMFVVDQTSVTGTDAIQGFAANDLLLLKEPLADPDHDGVTALGKGGKLALANGGSVSLGDSVASLRALGATADGYAYGDAKVWGAGATVPAVKASATYTAAAGNETWIATNAKETFYFDNQHLNTGADTIRSFGSDDLLVTSKALVDGNNDGLIVPGSSGLSLGNGGAVVKLPDLSKAGLRVLGQTDQGYVYGDAAVRPKGAVEGKLGTADTLTGDKGDATTDKFFFDTALHRSLGTDKVVNFGAHDVIVTTEQLGTGKAGSVVTALDGLFGFGHDGLDLGSLQINSTDGAPLTSLEFDGDKVVNGVHYYVYSSVHSTIGTEVIG